MKKLFVLLLAILPAIAVFLAFFKEIFNQHRENKILYECCIFFLTNTDVLYFIKQMCGRVNKDFKKKE